MTTEAKAEEKGPDAAPEEVPETEVKEESQEVQQPQIEIKPPVKEYDKVLQSIFDRSKQPLESVTVSMEVLGLYSLPESWKTRAPEEDTNRYEVTCSGLKVEGGKINPKQLTEEEKKALEEAQTKKKPAKPEKKKPEEEEAELKAKEEHEALLREQKLKQENERKLMDPQTLYYTEKEDPFMEAWVGFNLVGENNEVKANIQAQEFKEDTLSVFEESINQEHGCWLYFDRLPAIEDEDPKKKKPAPKKGAVEVDNKIVHGKAWLPFDQIIAPGGVEVDQRVELTTVIEEKKEEEPTEEKKEVKKEANKETKKEVKEEPNPEDLTIFETAKTYVHIKMTLSQPINPVRDPSAPANPADILGKLPPPLKAPSTKDATDMYRFQIQKNVKEMAADYIAMNRNDQDPGSQEKSKEQQMTQKQREKYLLKKRDEFMDELNRSGKYLLLKEELKKSVARIAYEKFKKLGVGTMTKDQFYSELYVYLIEQMHSTVDSIVTIKKAELPEDIVVAKEIEQKRQNDIMAKVFQETISQRLERLYKEYERSLDFDLAENYLIDIINLDKNNKDSWIRYYKFAMKIGDISKAEECLSEALAIDPENTDYLMSMTGILLHRKRYNDAEIHLKKILKKDFTYIPANILIAIIYELTTHNGLFKKHIEIAKRKKMRDLNLLPPKGSLRFDAPLPDPSRQLTNEEIDSLFYGLTEFLLKNKQSYVAEKVMSYIQDKDSLKYLMNLARCYFIRGAYTECLGELEKLLAKDPKNQRALKYKGHALYLQGNLFDSEEAYVNAIRTKPQPKSLTLYERLGQLYLKRKSWTDAQVVFYKCCAEPNMNSSVSWKKLGVSYLKLERLVEAEDALTQASILDNNNAEIWGYTTILCLASGKRDTEAEQALIEAFRLELRNVGILDEIGERYFNLGDHEKATECFERAVKFAPEDGELFVKLANCYINFEDRKKDAIDCYKKAMEYSEGETNKGKIAMILHNIFENDSELMNQYPELMEKIKSFIE